MGSSAWPRKEVRRSLLWRPTAAALRFSVGFSQALLSHVSQVLSKASFCILASVCCLEDCPPRPPSQECAQLTVLASSLMTLVLPETFCSISLSSMSLSFLEICHTFPCMASDLNPCQHPAGTGGKCRVGGVWWLWWLWWSNELTQTSSFVTLP